jgi:exosortase/archaeosortase family protein
MQQVRLEDKRSPYLFLKRFIVSFFLLYSIFPFYRGITGKGGKLYLSFLDHRLNFIKGFAALLTTCAKFLLQVFQYDVYQMNYHSLRIGYSKGISVNPSCLGWAVMSFWVAFVFANNGRPKHKMKWITIGVVSIMLLNITRIVLITIANHLNWVFFNSLDHHRTFNIASYTCIMIFIGCYIRMQKKYERNEFNARQEACAAG